ncbi:TPA: fimbria/pilus periplasmic chaperone [Escherichia coli]|uniref:fimbria/pilus periplasmic chaperone n=1 Tax=Escherichia coli TaxID=562 RepID=UPI001EB756C6|nr:fimbria/pilus periplasmic chaperone [Escherichia coli]EFI4023221.1 fimbria/pilus periplasmic chaperone [Escherichia coli]EKO8725065.1 fimbria/pilus periplasmic chaperone [Escherichia coli]MDZ3869586.1 fimbria/pilus periplasmic chaperone [Escherichia coli]HBK2954257.1 fimbria/pilus periplasmic chaperone [Escherichia coli]HCN1399691.1 fimbria/pilus periplasmic chaperone [Escherichia coli]
MRVLFVLVCIILFWSIPGQANMTVYPMSVSINSQGEGSVRVISKTDEVQYIKATVFRIDNPSTPQEKEIEVTSGDANQLVVMPPKFALPGGSSKTVRFVAMEPEQKEKNYRVKFAAVPSIDDATANKKDLSMQLTVNLIWGIVVSVPPQQPVAKLDINADKKLINNGNQRLKILTIDYCKKSGSAECRTQTVNKNIFPGQERSLEGISGYDKIVVKYNNWITKDNGEFELAVH